MASHATRMVVQAAASNDIHFEDSFLKIAKILLAPVCWNRLGIQNYPRTLSPTASGFLSGPGRMQSRKALTHPNVILPRIRTRQISMLMSWLRLDDGVASGAIVVTGWRRSLEYSRSTAAPGRCR